MHKYNKGIFEIGLVILGATIIAATFLVGKLNLASSTASEVSSCGSLTTQSSCVGSCSPTKSTGKSYACKWLSAQNKCTEASWECAGATQGGVCPGGTYKSGCMDNYIGEHCKNGKLCKTPIYDCYVNGGNSSCTSGGYAQCSGANCNGTYSGEEECTPDDKCEASLARTYSPRPTIYTIPTRSPSPRPTPTHSPSPRPTITASPNTTTKLIICKFNDEDGNGQINNNEKGMSWSFNVNYSGNTYKHSSSWWNFKNRGCVTINVPANDWIRIYEEGKNGWTQTGFYQDGNWAGTGEYSYYSNSGSQKKIDFLNRNTPQSTITPSPTGEPNSCNGTCGSNYNCATGYFCYIKSGERSGFCRNPNCSTENSCNCPGATTSPTAPAVVLGATAPPELPKTGSNDWLYVLSFMVFGGGGMWIFKRFRLV